MKKFSKILIAVFSSLIFLTLPSFGQSVSITINEILPAPKIEPYEWIEVVNTGSTPISASEIEIKDAAGNKLKPNFTILNPGDYGIATSSSILNNSGDTVSIILKSTGVEIEKVSYGSTDYDKSWSRCPNLTGNFILSSNPTKGQQNTCLTPTPTPTSTPTPTPSPTLTPTPSSSPTFTPTPTPTNSQTNISEIKIEISEVYPNPYTGENEWVEIYNPNTFQVNLNDWQIDDIEGGSSPIYFSTTLQPKSYFVIEIPKSMFNNTGDEVRLLDNTGKEVDKTSYTSSQKGYSWAKDNSGKWCLQTPSKNEPNPNCPTKDSNKNSNTTKTTSSSFGKKQKKSKKNKKIFPSKHNIQKKQIYLNTYQSPSILGESIEWQENKEDFKPKPKINLFGLQLFSLQFTSLSLLYFFLKTLSKLL